MKNIIYLLFFIPFISMAQTFVGQPIYTEAQRQEFKIRFISGPYKDRLVNSNGAFDGTFQKIIDQKNDFVANPNAGDWDFTPSANQSLHLFPTSEHGNPTLGDNGNIEDIHSAGIWAFTFYDDPNSTIAAEAATVGNLVGDEILARSRDANLDATNTTRFNPNVFSPNPYLFWAPKFTKYLSDYAMLKSVGIEGLSTSEENEVEAWFAALNTFWKAKLDYDLRSRLGTQWENEVYGSNSFNNVYNSGSSRRGWAHTNSSGTNDNGYRLTEKMAIGSNVPSDYALFVGLYGIVFNVSDSKDFNFHWFRDSLKFSVFPDGTHFEFWRTTDSKEDWGIFYGTISMGNMVKSAFFHAVGVENGLTGMSDKGKFFDFTTSLGTNSYAGTTVSGGGDTSGGNKGLLLVAQAWAKYYEQDAGASFGWQPQRYQDVNKGVELITGANHFHYISAAAAMNSWYNDSNIKQWYKGEGNYPDIKDRNSGAQNVAGYFAGEGNANEYHGVGLWFDMEDIIFSSNTATNCPVIDNFITNPIELDVNDSFTAPTVAYTDAVNGGGNATITSNTVNTASAGTYFVIYSQTNVDGCTDTETLTVNVTDPSNDCSVVTSTAGNSIFLALNDTYTEAGGTWTDVQDGSGAATVGGDTVDTSIRDTYIVTYSYIDTGGCTSSASLTVIVGGDVLMEFVDLTESIETVTVGSIVSPAYTSGPSNADIPYVYMYSSDPTIVERQSNGVSFLGLKEGVVTITLATADGTPHTDTLVLTVLAADEGDLFLPNITVSDADAKEGEPMSFIIGLSESFPEEIVLALSITNETADDSDYNLPLQTVVIAPGETEKTVVVETFQDSIEEEDEIFTLEIDVKQPIPTGRLVIQATGTILNDDVLEELKIYPNPASSGSQINISGIKEGTYQMSFYNLSGNLLSNSMVDFDGSSVEYALPSVGQGLYILNIEGFEGKHSGKIIIQ